jgi:acyl-CoA synthetase (AMP-forming)/AMP-acid ligase II
MRLHDVLDFQARERPDADFAVQGARRVSYCEALGESNRLANALIAAGLEKGDRIAYLGKNSIEHALMFFAASKAGVAPVPLNYRLAPPELAYIIGDARAKIVLTAADFIATIDAVRGDLASVERLIAIDAPSRPKGWQDYRAWLADQPATPPAREVSDEDDVYQMYTSGTTGRPKGAVLSHRAVMSNALQMMIGLPAITSDERCLIVAPMYHAAAAVTSFLNVLCGACLYIHEDFNPWEVVRVLSEERITTTTLVPAMIQACLVMVPDVAERRYDRLRLIGYGASPISEQTLRRAIEVFKCDFTQGYGMTETTSALTYLNAADHQRALREKPGLLLSAGRALVATEIRVVDENDRPVPSGTIGEVVGRGPQLMRGYWNLPEATAEALRGGWMHTGDAGIIDEEGYLYIQDRVKDMIVSGGENIYPREVEEVLYQHPAVSEAAVIGIPDEKFGEAVKAIIVVREGATANAEAVMEFCKGKLAGYKRPKSIDFIATLPRNPSGKVLKKELREPYWKGHSRRVS